MTARIWRVDAGRVPLFLLDTDCPENEPLERWITARLYVADPETRLAQYVAARRRRHPRAARARDRAGRRPPERGPRGARAARARGTGAARRRRRSTPRIAAARQRTVFTTHTPVPAGNDTYPPSRSSARSGRLADELSIPIEELIALGPHAARQDAAEEFGVTQAALRMSRHANAVSRRHGEVARAMWKALWPRRRVGRVPIGHVTNGVHVPTWIGSADARAARALPGRRVERAGNGSGRVDARRRDPRRRAVGGAPDASASSSSNSCASAARPTGWRGATRASTSRPRRGRSIPTS